MQKTGVCLPEADLNDYLNGTISEEKRSEIEKHLESCDTCLEKVVFAYQAVEEFNQTKSRRVKSMRNGWIKNLWLLGAILAFVLSFLVRRYFVQLLVANILMGVKWIFDSVNARILIMIYEAWKQGGEKEASKILKTLNDRF